MAATIADAIRARLQSVAPADVEVYDNEVPGVPAARYWVLYCGVGIWSASTYGGQYADNSVTVQLTTVASDQSRQQVAAQMCRWLESRGIALFDRIESDDHSAITGMPLIALATILRELGFAIP